MGDFIKLSEQDKVVLRKDSKTGSWGIKEIVLHDKDTRALIERSNSVLAQLKQGKEPMIATKEVDETVKKKLLFECEECGSKFPAFDNTPAQRYYCAKCGRWEYHTKVQMY